MPPLPHVRGGSVQPVLPPRHTKTPNKRQLLMSKEANRALHAIPMRSYVLGPGAGLDNPSGSLPAQNILQLYRSLKPKEMPAAKKQAAPKHQKPKLCLTTY